MCWPYNDPGSVDVYAAHIYDINVVPSMACWPCVDLVSLYVLVIGLPGLHNQSLHHLLPSVHPCHYPALSVLLKPVFVRHHLVTTLPDRRTQHRSQASVGACTPAPRQHHASTTPAPRQHLATNPATTPCHFSILLKPMSVRQHHVSTMSAP